MVVRAEARSSIKVTVEESAPEGSNSNTSNKRRLEDQDAEEAEQARSVVPRTASTTSPSQRRSRIPVASWRLEARYKQSQT
jgi:hypothetical protein